MIDNDLLYRQSDSGRQLVLPKTCRVKVSRVGHTIPWAGHLGFMKTFMRISKRFFWPGMYSEVPLITLPVISTPFEQIGVDIVGPVERSQTENKFILVMCDYATRYSESFPLRKMTAKQYRTLAQVYKLLGIRRVRNAHQLKGPLDVLHERSLTRHRT